MKAVTKDCLVRMAVRMSDLQGHVLDETPLEGVWYLHGHGDIFPAFEAKLEGKKVGAMLSFTLEPEEAFGEFDEQLVILRDAAELADPADVRVGLLFESVKGAKPSERPYRVTDLADGKALLDANHRLPAGRYALTSRFLKLPKLRKATYTITLSFPTFCPFKARYNQFSDLWTIYQMRHP